MQLPQQLLVLHRQTLVDLGLFLQRLLEFGLLAGQLPAVTAAQHRFSNAHRQFGEHTGDQVNRRRRWLFFFACECPHFLNYVADRMISLTYSVFLSFFSKYTHRIFTVEAHLEVSSCQETVKLH